MVNTVKITYDSEVNQAELCLNGQFMNISPKLEYDLTCGEDDLFGVAFYLSGEIVFAIYEVESITGLDNLTRI